MRWSCRLAHGTPSPAAYTLWVPTHLLGIALWLASKVTSHPALFPGFVVATVALTLFDKMEVCGRSLNVGRPRGYVEPGDGGGLPPMMMPPAGGALPAAPSSLPPP